MSLFLAITSVQGQVTTSDNSQIATETEISEASVKSLLTYLASDQLKGRATGTKGIEEAASHIESIFRKNRVVPYFKSYRDSFEVAGKTAYNIIGYVEGSDAHLKDEFIILGAHYDHIGEVEGINDDFIANGANDNASGTVAVVELAKHFARNKSNKRSLLFILFSAEESGLEGSRYQAKRISNQDIELYAMLNFEMIGIPMEGKDYLAYITGYEESNLAEEFNEYSNSEVFGFLPQAKEFNLFKRSDNYPFFEVFRIPAQTISTFDFTNYDYYHHVFDEADKIDFSHMVDVIENVIPGITKMTSTPKKEIKLHEQ